MRNYTLCYECPETGERVLFECEADDDSDAQDQITDYFDMVYGDNYDIYEIKVGLA